MTFLMENLSTIIILLIVIAAVCLAIRSIIRDRKARKGGGACPGGCHGRHGGCFGHEVGQSHGK